MEGTRVTKRKGMERKGEEERGTSGEIYTRQIRPRISARARNTAHKSEDSYISRDKPSGRGPINISRHGLNDNSRAKRCLWFHRQRNSSPSVTLRSLIFRVPIAASKSGHVCRIRTDAGGEEAAGARDIAYTGRCFSLHPNRIDRRSRVQSPLRRSIEAPRRRFRGKEASKRRGVFTVRFAELPRFDSIDRIELLVIKFQTLRDNPGHARETTGGCRAFSRSERRAYRSNERPSHFRIHVTRFRFVFPRALRSSGSKISRKILPFRAAARNITLSSRRFAITPDGDLAESHIARNYTYTRCDVA